MYEDDTDEVLGCFIAFIAIALVVGCIGFLIYAAANSNNQAIDKAKRNLHDDQYLYQDAYILNKPNTKMLTKDHYEINFNGNSITDDSNGGFDDESTCYQVINRYLAQFKNRKDYQSTISVQDHPDSYLMPIQAGKTTTYMTNTDDYYYGTLTMDKK